ISQVHLRTAKLEGALVFYTEVLGLRSLHRPGSHATLSATGAGPGLLVLTEDLNAPPCPPRSTGLYHFAIRYPSRQDLAHAYHRLVKSEYPVAGASDHGVSEALYLSDPDGNGVELYADRPRSQWNWRNGQIAMVTKALDLDELLAGVAHECVAMEPPPGSGIGHIHLHVD